jgi:hypothetical protein
VVFALSRACLLASTLRLTVLEFCIIIVWFRSQNILDLLRTKSSWKTLADATPPLPCFYPHSEWAARARCKLGFDLNTQVHHSRDEPGIVGAAIYRAILIDQHSPRSHPNKAVDVVVCQTSWIESGSRFINSGSALRNQSLGIVAACSPQQLRSRRYRRRLSMVQRLVHFSTHPQTV